MRKLTGTDITDFHTSGYDLLVLDTDGNFTHLDHSDIEDGQANAYNFCKTPEGNEVQILLERRTITDGEWFADALDDDGNLTPDTADEMADIITADGIIPSRALKAQAAGKAWEQKAKEADEAALVRAQAVADVVALLGCNQSAAARALSMNQSNVSRLMKKLAVKVGDQVTIPAHAIPENWPTTGEAIEIGEETTVVELDNGSRQELPNDEVTLA